MKILFILPFDNTYRYQGSFKKSVSYAPLTLTTLAALVPPELNAEITLVDEGVEKGEYAYRTWDIVGITCVASTAPRAYYLANYFQGRGSHVLLGGVHPTLMPDEAQRFCDSLFVGYAEDTLPQFFSDYLEGKPKKRYDHDASLPLSAPIPRRDLQRNERYISAPSIIANRGCRNNCDFCSIPRLWGRDNNTRPVEEVVEEIRLTGQRRFLFLDPSPDSNKDYARMLYEALIPLKIQWAGLLTSRVTKDKEFFDLIIRSGCVGTLIGFESLSHDSMVASRKVFNNVTKYREIVRDFHKHDISVLGTFVLGLDGDTPKSMAETVGLIDEMEVDLPRFAVLTPFPGTDVFRKLKDAGRIFTEDWSLYDSEHVVYEPKHFSPQELQHIFFEVYTKTYSVPRIMRRAARARHKLLIGAAGLGFRHYAYSLYRYKRSWPMRMMPD